MITAFISPFREDREQVRHLVEAGEFNEVYIKCDLDICEQRDPKGLYKKQETGKFRSLQELILLMKSRMHRSSFLIQDSMTVKLAKPADRVC